MEKIYMVAVSFDRYREPEVEAAFSTREKAEALAEALRSKQDYDRHHYSEINVSVMECPFDPDWAKGFYVIVDMDRTGALIEEPKRYIALGELPFQPKVGFHETNEGSVYLSHFAATDDKDAAVRQTNDIREQAINLGYWPESVLAAKQRLRAHLGIKPR